MSNNRKPLIIAHRGAKGSAPENTLGSFRLAMEQGCDAIELDVHLSKDGEIIVCHDFTLDRTTNGAGFIGELTLAEIKRFDAGSWHSEAYRGETVPTLGEVFDLVPETIMINVEVKHHYDGRLEQKLVALLNECGRLDSVVVSSFDHKSLCRIKRLEPKTRIGLLYSAKLVDPTAYARSFDCEVYSLHPHFSFMDKEDVEKAVANGLAVFPWTANEENDLRKLVDYGVSGIITDYPGRLRALLYPEAN